MRRLLLIFITAAVVPLFIHGQGGYAPDPTLKSECKLSLFQGLNLDYNERYIDAEDRFDEYSRCDPADPIGEWRKSYSEWFRLRVEQKTDTPKMDAAAYASFMVLAERGMKKAATKIAQGNDIDFYRYVAAEIRSVEAVMTLRNDGKFSAWRSRTFMHEAVAFAQQSRYQDALCLLGFTNYKASQRDSFLQWLSGLPHDRCKGLSLLQAAEKGNLGIFSDDVRLVVASISAAPKEVSAENRRQCSGYRPDASFDELLVRYPRNTLLQRIVLGLGR